jgi:hypothetical protein
MIRFHVEQWTGHAWVRISGTRGYDRLEQAEMQKAARAKSTRTDIDNFSIVCIAG